MSPFGVQRESENGCVLPIIGVNNIQIRKMMPEEKGMMGHNDDRSVVKYKVILSYFLILRTKYVELYKP